LQSPRASPNWSASRWSSAPLIPRPHNFACSKYPRLCAHRLNASGALADVARRHAGYFLGILATVDDVRQSQPADEYLPMFRRYADEIDGALGWAFSPAGDPGIGVTMTIAAIPLWFELFQIVVARTRLGQALRCAEPGSDQEMRLRIAIGHALWYIGPEKRRYRTDLRPCAGNCRAHRRHGCADAGTLGAVGLMPLPRRLSRRARKGAPIC